MESFITLTYFNQYGHKLEEIKIPKQKSYHDIILYINNNITQNFDLYIINEQNIKKYILSENDFSYNIDHYYIKDNNRFNQSLFTKVMSNLSETQQEEYFEKFCCPLCGDRIKNENPYFCYQCQYIICKSCLEKLDKNTRPLSCPKCKMQCPIEDWKTLKNFVENQQKELGLLSKLLNKNTKDNSNISRNNNDNMSFFSIKTEEIEMIKDDKDKNIDRYIKEIENLKEKIINLEKSNKKKDAIIMNKDKEIKIKDQKISELSKIIEKLKKNDKKIDKKNDIKEAVIDKKLNDVNVKDDKNLNTRNQIFINLNIEEGDVNQKIYFLDNTDNDYYENGEWFAHHHDNLPELNDNNTEVYINDQQLSKFDKYFVPKIKGSYRIKIIFKIEVKNYGYMFCGCNNIISVDFSKFNSENTTNMDSMFRGCRNLINIDLSSFKTKNVTNLAHMFDSCENLSKINLSGLNTQNVTNMEHMFISCKKLINIDLSSFDTRNVVNMRSMFSYCAKLKKINISTFNTKKVTNMKHMFDGCNELTTINLKSFDTQNVNNMENMFSYCSNLANIDLSKINTQKVKNMESMFRECHNLTKVDLSSSNIQNVNRMGYMFYGCYNLQRVNFSIFGCKNLTNITSMFCGCNNLVSIDLSSFNTQNVNDMRYIFYGCNNVTNIDLSSFNLDNVTDMSGIFRDCTKLIEIKVNKEIYQKIKEVAPPSAKLIIK